jgi:hypothetical protein
MASAHYKIKTTKPFKFSKLYNPFQTKLNNMVVFKIKRNNPINLAYPTNLYINIIFQHFTKNPIALKPPHVCIQLDKQNN